MLALANLLDLSLRSIRARLCHIQPLGWVGHTLSYDDAL